MCKISAEVIKLLEKTWKPREWNYSRRKTLSWSKDPKRYIQLLFVKAMMPLNHILRKCTAGYKLSKSLEKTNHLINMNDTNCLQNKKKKKSINSNTRNENILSRHRDWIWNWKCTLLIMKMWKTIHDGRSGTTKSRKKLERSKKRKPTNTWVSWNQIPSNT